MKTIIYFFTILLLNWFLLACNATDNPSPDAEPEIPTQGTPTATGKPAGQSVTKIIGPEGGTITTPDNLLTIKIPAGALRKETTVSIQPVENKAWSGVGLGYEITPKDLVLAKPAELTWHYSDSDVAGSAPEALGIAFQQDDNSWQGRSNVTVDRQSRQISTPVTKLRTAAFFEQYYLEPKVKSVAPAERQKLDVYFHPGYSETEILVPLVRSVLKSTEVKNWRINGIDLKGEIDQLLGGLAPIKDGASATYIAPSHVPKNNSVAVSVEVNLKGTKSKLILISNLTIAGENNFKINGSRVDSADVVVMAVADGKLFQIALGEPQGEQSKQAMVNLNIMPFSGTGTYQVEPNDIVTIHAYDSNAKRFSESYSPRGGKKVYGPVTVYITEYDALKKVVKGGFSGTLHNYDEKTDKHESATVSANFRAASPY